MSAADGPLSEVLDRIRSVHLAKERPQMPRPTEPAAGASHHLRAPLRDPTWAPLAERPDRPVFYFNPNSSTKNVGQILQIDIVAQVPSPFLAWRC